MYSPLIVNLAFFTLCTVGLAAQASVPNVQNPTETPKIVHQLYAEDQEDMQGDADGKPHFTEEQYQQRVEAREATVRAMLAAGELKTGDDFEDASYIFQHGGSPDDCLFAHILAIEAMVRGKESARWIAAATLDRYLQSIKQPQVFGTQYPFDPNLPHTLHTGAAPFRSGRTLEPYNASLLPDSVRTDFCVPVLAQQKQNVATFNTGTWPREAMHPPCR